MMMRVGCVDVWRVFSENGVALSQWHEQGREEPRGSQPRVQRSRAEPRQERKAHQRSPLPVSVVRR